MSSIKTLIRENINDIVNDLNEELLQDRIVRFWDKVNTIDRNIKPYGYTLDELVSSYKKLKGVLELANKTYFRGTSPTKLKVQSWISSA